MLSISATIGTNKNCVRLHRNQFKFLFFVNIPNNEDQTLWQQPTPNQQNVTAEVEANHKPFDYVAATSDDLSTSTSF